MADVINIIRMQVAPSVEAELNAEAITTSGWGERKRAREREGASKEMHSYVML